MKRRDLSSIKLKKPRKDITDEEILILNNIFQVTDIAELLGCSKQNMSQRIIRAKRRQTEESTKPVIKSKELTKNIQEIIELERDQADAVPEGRTKDSVISLLNISEGMLYELKGQPITQKLYLEVSKVLITLSEARAKIYRIWWERVKPFRVFTKVVSEILETERKDLQKRLIEKIEEHPELKQFMG